MRDPSSSFSRAFTVVVHAGYTNRCVPEALAYEEERRMKMEGAVAYWPVPRSADEGGTTWQVCRAWPVRTPGDYVLEVRAAGRPGVWGARLRGGRFKLIPPDDPRLPALRAEAGRAEVVSYRPYRQAVIRADDGYIKVFRPGRSVGPAESCARMDLLLAAGTFSTPRILQRRAQDVIVFSALPGRTLSELGGGGAAVPDEAFVGAWEKWSRAWVAQLGFTARPALRRALNDLPLHSPEVEAAGVRRRVDGWLQHTQGIPELSAPGNALRTAAEQVATNLLRTAPDPFGWSHGDLHDKQILVADGQPLPGLLDFDSTARAEAALDLADLDVHVELHLRQEHLAPARYRTAHTQVLAVAQELHVSPHRFLAYSDAIWLRLACSPLPGRLPLALAVLGERLKDHPALPSHRLRGW